MSKQDLKKYDALFFSPHIDDAIFSCGGLILKLLKQKRRIAIINIFTKANDHKSKTDSIKQELKKNNFKSAKKLYSSRKKSEREIARKINVDVFFLDFEDGLFRKNIDGFLYPSYKNLFSGKINKNEKDIIEKIKNKISPFTNNCKKETAIYAPIGIGKHIDHIITKKVIKQINKNLNIFLWEDIPYSNNICQKKQPLELNLEKLIVLTDAEAKQKKELCEMYETQFKPSSKTAFSSTNFYKEVIYKL